MRARVYRIDASSDILNVAGLLATSGTGTTTTPGVTLKINYSSNDYTKLNFSLYSYTAAMSGNFFDATGGTADRLQLHVAPCLALTLTANGQPSTSSVNAVATVDRAPLLRRRCAFGPPTSNPPETKSIYCGQATSPTTGLPVQPTCTPTLVGELKAIIKPSSVTLRVSGGAAIGGSHQAHHERAG